MNTTLAAFEAEQRRRPVDYHQNLRIYNVMYQEARALGIFPLDNLLDGIEHDIRRTRRLHVLNERHR